MFLIPKSSEYDIDFIRFIRRYVINTLLKNVDINKLSKYNDHFERLFNGRFISAYQIFIDSINNIIIQETDNQFILSINPNIYYINSEIKLIDLANTINYGTLEIEGYPIISNVMNTILKKLNRLYDMYLEVS